jgi:energy-coupling factor transporter ATP-binding protein EcfA2
VFLVGPNASGKSNLLDAIRFVSEIAEVGGGIQDAVARRGGVAALRCYAARRYPDVGVSISVGTTDDEERWRYELAFNQDQQRQLRIKYERVLQWRQAVLERPMEQDRSDPERLSQTNLEQVQANADFRDLVSFLRTIRYLHVVPQLIRDPDRSVGHANDPYGGDFLEQLARTNKRTQEAWLRRITQALKIAVPQLSAIELFRDTRGVPHLRGRYDHWRLHGAWQTEEQFSDGTLRLLGLLWSVLDGAGPLLLEEPELNLHPGIVRQLPQMLQRVQRQSERQIILSTHSPDLLADEGIEPAEVLLLRLTNEGTRVEPATAINEVEPLLRAGMSLGEIALTNTEPKGTLQLAQFGS